MPTNFHKRLREPSPKKLRKSARLQRNLAPAGVGQPVVLAGLDQAVAYVQSSNPPAAVVRHETVERGMPPPAAKVRTKKARKKSGGGLLISAEKEVAEPPSTPLSSTLDNEALQNLRDEDPAGLVQIAQQEERLDRDDPHPEVRMDPTTPLGLPIHTDMVVYFI